jgi:hypothetical protein
MARISFHDRREISPLLQGFPPKGLGFSTISALTGLFGRPAGESLGSLTGGKVTP